MRVAQLLRIDRVIAGEPIWLARREPRPLWDFNSIKPPRSALRAMMGLARSGWQLRRFTVRKGHRSEFEKGLR